MTPEDAKEVPCSPAAAYYSMVMLLGSSYFKTPPPTKNYAEIEVRSMSDGVPTQWVIPSEWLGSLSLNLRFRQLLLRVLARG